jgi:hypothetical protein
MARDHRDGGWVKKAKEYSRSENHVSKKNCGYWQIHFTRIKEIRSLLNFRRT